ncbi:unnamed protein product [Thelazia callipaeda]|uniref:RUN domain-containing protein n=1 Tax=Thelazia callipaeda TaxID=103827 RepID=A0A0N5D3Y9_THECL|nr:unnamed protein product [Thelazia callipaeda]
MKLAQMIRYSSVREASVSDDFSFLRRKHSESGIERMTRNGSVVKLDFNFETPNESDQRKENLLNILKKEVKNVMEESINRKLVNAKSTYVISLCAAIEQCLLDGLKRRLLGLFGARSTYALLHNISKFCPEAAEVLALTIKAQDDEVMYVLRIKTKVDGLKVFTILM